jgi:hypothetical protein
MPHDTTVHTSLTACLDAVRRAGCDVHVPQMADRRTAGFVYITRIGQPGCALLQVSGFPVLGQPLMVSVPVHPARGHGSAVLVDFSGEPADLPGVLDPVLASPTVQVCRVRDPKQVPVDRRIPRSAALLPAIGGYFAEAVGL